jgi:hypothetical protein
MQDTAVSHTPGVVKPVNREDEDELLARVLITSWTLATGRTLRPGVPPHSHTEEELISFWADDQIAIAAPGAAQLR